MSFTDKLNSLMARPGQEAPKDDVPWWLRYGGRIVGTLAGILAIFLGVANCIGLITADVKCLVSGLWQMVLGFATLCIEAPCCCLFVDFVQNLSDWVDKRPYWNKAVAYIGLSLPAIILCPSIGSIFGSGLILVTGVIYGMMVLGKKASAEEMRATATTDTFPSPTPKSVATMRLNLVENAQPISFTGAPISDSHV